MLPPRACDPSINIAVLQRSRDGNAVAAVDDVIAVRLSVQDNRRQRVAFAVRQCDPCPAPAHRIRRGAEVRIEAGGWLERADDCPQRHYLEP